VLTRPADSAVWLKTPGAAKLSHLRWEDVVGKSANDSLATSHSLTGIRTFDARWARGGYSFDDNAMRALARSPVRLTVVALELKESFNLGNEAIDALVATEWPCLQYLSLVGTYVNDEGVKALAAWPGLARIIYLHVGDSHDQDPLTVANLEYLNIEGHNFYAPGDTIESAQAKQIIALSKLGALKKLEFCNFYDNLWDSETSELNAERAALVPTWRGTTWEDFGQN